MEQFLASIIVITVIFAVCFAAMNIGMFVRGKKMRGGCGSHENSGEIGDKKEEHTGCGFCPEKKKLNICSSESKDGLKDISKLGMLGRYDKQD